MSLHRPRTAAAAGLLVLPLIAGVVSTASTAPVVSLVLSVGSGFDAAQLPRGAEVVDRMDRVGAVHVTAPSSAASVIAALPHVRGVRPDVGLRPMAHSTASSGGVLAPEAVGGAAGSPTAGQGVTVAVVDTGVADTPALNRATGSLRRGPNFSGADSSERDGFGHGTFMANLVAGGVVDGTVIGVAPAARVVDVKVAGPDGSTSLSKVLKGLDWVAEQGSGRIQVLSLSLGAPRPTEAYGADPLTDAADAVQRQGITVVTASGNDPSQVSNPGQDPQLFTIGAADTREAEATTASFSGRGYPAGMRKPDVVAAGVRVLSLLPAGSEIALSNPAAKAGSLWRGSGTSQATAVAAGAVSVFLSGRSGVSPQDVRASFGTAARDLPGGEADGYGLLVLPTELVDGDADLTPPAEGGGEASADSTSWSSTSWSRSTSWSSTSWSRSTSWSSTSWSRSTSWSSTSWSRSTSWSASSWA